MINEKTKKYFIVILLALFMTLLSSCGSKSVSKVISALNEANYEDARSIYREKIAGDYDREQELFITLNERINNAISDYNSGKIGESEAYSILESVRLSDLLDKTEVNFNEKYASLDALVFSKKAYSYGITCLSEQMYLDAYNQLSQVIPADINYHDAQENMIEAKNAVERQVIAEYELFFRQHDYKSAANTLNEALIYFPDNPTFISAMNKLVNEWQTATLNAAAACFADGNDYQGAITILQQSGLTGEVIDAEIAHYQSYMPVSLVSLGYTQKAKYIAVGTEYDNIAMDVGMTTHPKNSIIHPTGGSLNSQFAQSEQEAYVCFYLNGQYSNLQGLLFRPYQSLSSSKPWDVATVVRMYGDGVLLYEAPNVTQNTYDTQSININVSGVRELKIVMLGVWIESGGWPGLYNHNPKVCLSDLTLRK